MSSELDEIQAIFFEECTEGLAVAESGLSAMVAGDASADVIAGVFRAVHSIKGGAGAFGHDALLHFSHAFENVLDKVRAGDIPATPGICQQLLSAFDILSDHVGAAIGRNDVPVDGPVKAMLEAILAGGAAAADDAQVTPAAVAPVSAAAPPSPPAETADGDDFGFVPVSVALDDFDEGFGIFADETPTEAATLEEEGSWRIIFAPSRAAMTNGAEPLNVLRELESMGGVVTGTDLSSLPTLRDLDPEQAYIGWSMELPGSVDKSELDECFDFVAPDSRIEYTLETVSPPVAEAFHPADTTTSTVKEQDTVVPATPSETAITAQNMTPVAAVDNRMADSAAQTIRIDVARLDMLLNLVGELVIRNSILTDRLEPEQQERVELPQLGRLTREIQDNVMSLRAQPIRQAFSRVPRIVRELCAATQKQVNLAVFGEATEVDKSVIEKIGEPLTHMIRNAIDHGLETPEEREAAGKNPIGTVRLSAEQKGARIVIQVSDDGRGIDRVRVRQKAIDKGIIAADAVLTDEDIDNLICAPGFSTAETISNISGRGVGMDVVRTNVEALGGRIEIASSPGQGTSFTMVLPLTLAILDGMIVRLSGQRYVVPLAHVVESIRPDPGQVKALSPTSEVIDLRGSYVPVRRVSDLLNIHANDRRNPEESLVIIVESDGAGCIGLMVDTIDDRRELVVKSLDQHLYPINGLSGATILGDGTIALILDIDALVSTASVAGARFTMKGMAA
jgi:two-component system, chemotaxis family, sensor kinase CheA